jgi:tryptophan synthase alpha chain
MRDAEVRRYPEGQEEVTTRIDATFAELAKQGSPGFRHLPDGRRSDPKRRLTSSRRCEGGCRYHRDRHALLTNDGGWPVDPGGGPGALKGRRLKKTLELVRGFRKDDDATPLVLMGYYNPICTYAGVDSSRGCKDRGCRRLIIVDLPPEKTPSCVCRR